APANKLIKYKTVRFESGFAKKTPYMGPPTEAYDKAWEDLYNYGIIKIPQSEAAQLVNYTMPLASEPGMYMVELDVFHQLHCLVIPPNPLVRPKDRFPSESNTPFSQHHIHKKAWGHDMGVNMSDPDDVENFWTHLDHCSESIRQNLMCSSDLSTIHWLCVEEDQTWKADGRVMHTCRDFEAIRDWAFENRAGMIDRTVWVPDPLRGEI
ncbi:oxidase ustYa family protein, partial [Aspergillus neoniger CBS 115656]